MSFLAIALGMKWTFLHQSKSLTLFNFTTFDNLYIFLTCHQWVLTNWYRQQLKAELPNLIAKWEKVIGVKTNDWGVKKMKTRWGTCNIQAKRIWLNLELVKKPQHCLEYVIVHELVHLLERKHNARFWNYISQFMPEWKQYQAELNCSFLI